ncbi:MAG: dipeptidyl carboxypeptidase II, partial [Candidatus Eremiobacteraeota bacterium]|nr:dipeptidyl carboxypeptidase II [Candidatus Eremiobacteraeota bacterium]
MRSVAVFVAALAVLLPFSAPSASENALMQPSTLPFGAPPFDRIQDTDYLPAFQAGMAQHLKEIEAIANNAAPPTFDDTFVAMEKSGRLLTRASNAFDAVAQANTNPTLQHTREVIAPMLAAHEDAIYLNPKLFARVRTIYAQLPHLNLDAESRRLVQVYYDDFLHAGAQLAPAQQAKLREINKQLAVLRADYQRKVLAGTAAGALTVTDKSKLSGLNDSAIAASEAAAKAKQDPAGYLIALQNTTQQPALAQLNDRTTRQQLFENSWTRNEKSDQNDTRSTIAQIAKLRAEKAHLLGYPNYAAYALTQEMARTPGTVQTFLHGLIGAT